MNRDQNQDMKLDKEWFMEDLQQYDCLYNIFSRDFKDKYKKMNCWAALGEKHNIGPQEAGLVLKNIIIKKDFRYNQTFRLNHE